jgi:hypothetical protein
VERRRAGDELDVLLDSAQLERHAIAGQRAHDVDEEARRQHYGTFADYLAVERDAQPDLHVGCPQLDGGAGGEQLDAGERLDGATGRGGPRHGLELGEQRLALSRNLHLVACFRVD